NIQQNSTNRLFNTIIIESLSMAPPRKVRRYREQANIFSVVTGGDVGGSVVIWGVIYSLALLPPCRSFGGKTKMGSKQRDEKYQCVLMFLLGLTAPNPSL
ncbi:hypothetical protein IRJ41_018518, partial [Triplophysa rosa]